MSDPNPDIVAAFQRKAAGIKTAEDIETAEDQANRPQPNSHDFAVHYMLSTPPSGDGDVSVVRYRNATYVWGSNTLVVKGRALNGDSAGQVVEVEYPRERVGWITRPAKHEASPDGARPDEQETTAFNEALDIVRVHMHRTADNMKDEAEVGDFLSDIVMELVRGGQMHLVLWSGGYEQPQAEIRPDQDSAFTLARAWRRDAHEESDFIDVFAFTSNGLVAVEVPEADAEDVETRPAKQKEN